MKKIFAWAIASMAIFANLAFLAVPNIAHAACSYKIVRFDANGKKTAKIDDTLNFTASMERSGSYDSSCFDNVRFELYLKDGSSFLGTFKDTYLDGRSASFKVSSGQQGSIATVNFQQKIQSIDTSNLSNPSQLTFYVKGMRDGYTAFEPLISGDWVVNITGAATGPFSIKLDPIKQEYNNGDNFKLNLYVNPFTLKIDPSFSKIYIVVKVQGNKIKDYTINRSEINGVTYSTGIIQVNSQNKFLTGSNTIDVELWQAGTSVEIARASISIVAKGIGATTPTTPGKTTNPGDQPTTQNPGDQPGGEPDPTLNETLYNPLPTESLTGTILTIAKGFLAIVALWAVVFIIIGGFRMVLSQGNEEAYLAAKKTVTWAVLGVVVAMLSFSIIAIVQSLLGVTVPNFPGSQTPVVENKETNQ